MTIGSGGIADKSGIARYHPPERSGDVRTFETAAVQGASSDMLVLGNI